MKQLFVAWTPFMRRPESMQSFFGYRLHFVGTSFGPKWLKPAEYLVKAVQTFALLIRNKPDVLWVQVAPTFLMYIAFLYKWLFRRKMAVIADCHNSMYRKPWIAMPGAVALLNACSRVLVHNAKVMLAALQAGVREERLAVLETRPARIDAEDSAVGTGSEGGTGNTGSEGGVAQTGSAAATAEPYRRPWVLVPCSFDADEPVDQVIAAARLVPGLTFVMTGNPAKYRGNHDLRRLPANLGMTGYLPRGEYNALLASCDFVMGLTTKDDVQLSVANEAVGIGKPMVISDSPLLRQLFYRGAVYVSPHDPAAIAVGLQAMLERKAELAADVVRLRKERHERWLEQAGAVQTRMLDTERNSAGQGSAALSSE